MVDAATSADAFDRAADPAGDGGVGDVGQWDLHALGVLDGVPADDHRALRCTEIHLGNDAASQFQSATGPRLQTEFQVDVESETTFGPVLGGPAGVGVHVGLPEPDELFAVHDVGRQQLIAQHRVGPGPADDGLGEFGKVEFTIAERPAQGSAQSQAVGACLHESGAVRGVLHAVGKHQRFLLGSVEVLVTEQVRQGHRQLGGDGAAEEPDAVSGTAGRTHVVSGLFIGIRPVQGQYRKYLSLNCFGTLWVRCGGLELTVVEVEPPQILHLGGDLRFRGGGDERTEAWRSGGVVGSDGFIGDIERAAGGGQPRPPARASAMPAVHRGQVELGVVGDRAVVGPAVGSGGLHRAIDATEFTNPQVYVDAQCRPTDLGAHMRQHREQVLEVADSLRLDAGGVAFTDGRWEHPLGESGQQHRVDGAAQYLGDERMPLELIEHRCGVEGVGNIREQGSEDRFRDGGVVARLVVGGHDRIECIRQHRYDAVKLVVALPRPRIQPRLGREAGFPDHRLGAEFFAEHGVGKIDHRGGCGA
ncbi:Uncharacterised protein [Mycobacteroides abscessus subsp. abscessus]|nr:Uncharacterised protein [Mycobacteroides abscessus subsp. abscessus]